MGTQAFQWQGELALYASGDEPLANDEWQRWLETLADPIRPNPRVLVLARTAAPDANQRAELFRALGHRQVRLAVVTDAPWARAIQRHFEHSPNIHLRGFSTTELTAAFRFLRVSSGSVPSLTRRLEILRTSLVQV